MPRARGAPFPPATDRMLCRSVFRAVHIARILSTLRLFSEPAVLVGCARGQTICVERQARGQASVGLAVKYVGAMVRRQGEDSSRDAKRLVRNIGRSRMRAARFAPSVDACPSCGRKSHDESVATGDAVSERVDYIGPGAQEPTLATCTPPFHQTIAGPCSSRADESTARRSHDLPMPPNFLARASQRRASTANLHYARWLRRLRNRAVGRQPPATWHDMSTASNANQVWDFLPGSRIASFTSFVVCVCIACDAATSGGYGIGIPALLWSTVSGCELSLWRRRVALPGGSCSTGHAATLPRMQKMSAWHLPSSAALARGCTWAPIRV